MLYKKFPFFVLITRNVAKIPAQQRKKISSPEESKMKSKDGNPLHRLTGHNENPRVRQLMSVMTAVGFISVLLFFFTGTNIEASGGQNQKVDMHTHSTESDGDLTAEQLIEVYFPLVFSSRSCFNPMCALLSKLKVLGWRLFG